MSVRPKSALQPLFAASPSRPTHETPEQPGLFGKAPTQSKGILSDVYTASKKEVKAAVSILNKVINNRMLDDTETQILETIKEWHKNSTETRKDPHFDDTAKAIRSRYVFAVTDTKTSPDTLESAEVENSNLTDQMLMRNFTKKLQKSFSTPLWENSVLPILDRDLAI